MLLWFLHRLVEETNDLSSNVFSPSLLVIHDAGRGGENDVTELTRRKELDDPLLEVTELDVVTGRDDAGLVQSSIELDDDLAGAVVIDFLELANVAMLLHNLQELDNDLRARSDQALALAGLLGVVDGLERIVEDGGLDHDGGCREILSSAMFAGDEVSVNCGGSHCVSLQEASSAKSALREEGVFSPCRGERRVSSPRVETIASLRLAEGEAKAGK